MPILPKVHADEENTQGHCKLGRSYLFSLELRVLPKSLPSGSSWPEKESILSELLISKVLLKNKKATTLNATFNQKPHTQLGGWCVMGDQAGQSSGGWVSLLHQTPCRPPHTALGCVLLPSCSQSLRDTHVVCPAHDAPGLKLESEHKACTLLRQHSMGSRGSSLRGTLEGPS